MRSGFLIFRADNCERIRAIQMAPLDGPCEHITEQRDDAVGNYWPAQLTRAPTNLLRRTPLCDWVMQIKEVFGLETRQFADVPLLGNVVREITAISGNTRNGLVNFCMAGDVLIAQTAERHFRISQVAGGLLFQQRSSCLKGSTPRRISRR